MKIRLIKPYQFAQGITAPIGTEAIVKNHFGNELIDKGIAEMVESENQKPYNQSKLINTDHKDQTEEE